MYIKSVILENIRSYTKEEINFHQGSTLLSGDIGSGKTTILLAMEFCLFGMRRDLSGNALLRNGSNEGSVELNFDVDGRNVIIKRTLKRYKDGVKQTSGYIIANNIRSDLTAQEIKARVLELLGYPMTLLTKSKNIMYKYTVYTQQDDMKQILLDDKDNRVDTLRKIFGIDKYKNIRENSLIYIKNIKDRRNILKGRIEDLDNKKIILNNKTDVINKLDFSIKKINKDIFELNFDENKRKFSDIEIRLNEFNKLKSELDVLNAKLEEKSVSKDKIVKDLDKVKIDKVEIESKIDKIKIKRPTDNTIEELNKLISEKRINSTDAVKTKNVLEEKSAHIKRNIIDITEEVDSKSEKIKDLKFKKENIEQLKQDLEEKNKIKQSISELNEKLGKINLKLNEFNINMQNSAKLKKHIGDMSKCPTCLQTVSIDHKFTINQKEAGKISKLNILMQRYDKEKKIRDKELEDLNKRLEELIGKENIYSQLIIEVRNLDEISSEVDKKKKILIELNKELEKVYSELKEVNKVDVDKLNKEIDDCKRLLDKINEYNMKLKERKYLQEQLADKNKSLEDLENRSKLINEELVVISKSVEDICNHIKEFGDIEKEFVKEKEEYEIMLSKHKDLLMEKASVEKEHEVMLKQVSELKLEIENKEKDKNKIVYYNQLQNWLENHFIKLMSVMEKNVMYSIYEQFNDLFKEWFDILMEDEMLNVRLDEEFTPVIEQNGYDIDFNNLSGGERTSVALSYRLALNKVVNEVQSQIKTKDLLILDEPTDGFSTEQLDKVRVVLDELGLGQVIIVSHESKIESFVENVIRVEKSEHVSCVVT